MKAASQVIIDLTSFMVAFVLGSVFDTAFWQAGFHAKKLLGGKPLPTGTEFFIKHHHLPAYLALFPWLWLVGAPVFTLHATRHYWDGPSFVLRFLAFISCEVLLVLMWLLFLFPPFVTYYGVLQSNEQSIPGLVARLLFWLVVLTILIFGLCRTHQIRRNQDL